MTLLYFSLSSLDLLKGIDIVLPKKELKTAIINWVYSQQILPKEKDVQSFRFCGFRGGPYMGSPFNSTNYLVSTLTFH